MEESGALGAETDMERVRSLSVWDPDSGKVGSSDMLATLVIMAMVSPALKNGSQSHRRHQWVKHNRFSPLSELSNEMGTEFGEVEDRDEVFSDYHEVVVQSRSVASVGFSHNDSGLLFLPWTIVEPITVVVL